MYHAPILPLIKRFLTPFSSKEKRIRTTVLDFVFWSASFFAFSHVPVHSHHNQRRYGKTAEAEREGGSSMIPKRC